MKNLFYFWLLIQIIITGLAIADMEYRAENCIVEEGTVITKQETAKIGVLFPVPLIVWYLSPREDVVNTNCEILNDNK